MAEQAQKTAIMLGVNLELPNWVLGKPATLNIHRSGRLICEIEKDANSPQLPGWLVKGKKFVRVFNMNNKSANEPEAMRLDDRLRQLISEQMTNVGWVVKTDGYWHQQSNANVKAWLKSQGYKEPDLVMGSSVDQCWMLVNRPFREEYPKDRQWNRDAAKLRFKPSVDRDNLQYPTWQKILNHVGESLNDAIARHQWCKSNGVRTGADYIKIWIAAMFQEPLEPLPYLFLYGPQNSGKTVLHEAISCLMTRGVMRADNALTSSGSFNGELENAVLCVVEETDMRKNMTAYNRLKDWVTSRMISVHAKTRQPFMAANATHWVHCANSHLACPIFPGDSRITMILVDNLPDGELIPKKEMLRLLETEAPDFLAEILSLELPNSNDRLSVPVITTEDKIAAEHGSKSPLDVFIEEKCFKIQGQMIKFSDFYDKFIEGLDPNLIHQWSKKRVGQEFPTHFPRGRFTGDSQHHIGNISFEQNAETKIRLITRDGILRYEEKV